MWVFLKGLGFSGYHGSGGALRDPKHHFASPQRNSLDTPYDQPKP